MTSKAYWKKQTLEFVSQLENVSTVDQVEVCGYTFDVLPGVFSPAISSDTEWFAEKMLPHFSGKSVLEIGSGCGVIACLAALNGATRVVATDINPTAVENIRENQKNHHLNFPVRLGNLYEPLKPAEQFDVIFWNHPFNHVEDDFSEPNILSRSVFDPKYLSLKNYFRAGKKHLKLKGKLFLGTSNIARINLIKQIAREEEYSYRLLEKKEVPFSKGSSTKMDIRIYSFNLN